MPTVSAAKATMEIDWSGLVVPRKNTAAITATPASHTYAFFHKNVVSEYTHTQAVRDRVNVPFQVYEIATRVTAGLCAISNTCCAASSSPGWRGLSFDPGAQSSITLPCCESRAASAA